MPDESTPFAIPPMRLRRRIEGISTVLLPFGADDRPDWESFRRLLDRTWAAGLTPAVNMDTGHVNLTADDERSRVLTIAAEVGEGRVFVAGAFIEGKTGDPASLYRHEIERIRLHGGGTPILFQCSALAGASEQDVLAVYRRTAET